MEEIGVAICDANVLIDFAQVDPDIIRDLVAFCGTVVVPDIVLHEVKALDRKMAEELGLTIVETPLSLVRNPRLSLQDTACLRLLKDNGWACIANDKRLRTECRVAGGKVYWGLEVLAFMTNGGMVPRRRAMTIAKAICDTGFNRNVKLFEEFVKLLHSP